jgi:thiol-disulfide isomerase/thioredoxin
MTFRLMTVLAAASCGAAIALAAAAPPASPAARPLRGFVRDVEFVLEVDGAPAPVELYKSESAGAIVLLSPSFRRPLVLHAGELSEVDARQVEKHTDATLDLAPDARLSPRGSFAVTPDGVRFTLDRHQASVRHTTLPPLLGLRRLDEVATHNPEYLAAATAYAPDAPAMAALRAERRPVVVRVYYGSWCGHCRLLVPHAVKVEQQLAGGGAIRFEYFGLRDPATDPAARQAGVAVIPTAVVTVSGSEAGRIATDSGWAALEVTLRDVLAGRGGVR